MTAPADATELTRHIETRFHDRHRTQLPELIGLAARVESVHAGAPGVPVGLASALQRLNDDLALHMAKEENILFPAIRRGGMPGIEHPIAVMRADHDGHADEVARLLALTGNLNLPAGACGTWTRLYEGLSGFLADLNEHTHLENDVLFPMFEAPVPAPTPSLHKGCACHGG